MSALLVALGAAVGSVLRFVVADRWDDDFPTGTLMVNAVGSFGLGLISGWGVGAHVSDLLGIGLCGGLTTYSAFALQTYRRGAGLGTGYAVATIALGLGACTVGFALGQYT